MNNCNPFNIPYRSSEHWKHQIKSKVGLFCQFDSELYGVRAGLVLLRQYMYNYGLDTPHKLFSRFYFPSDSNFYDLEIELCEYLNEFCHFNKLFHPDYSFRFDFFDFTSDSILYRFSQFLTKSLTGYVLDLKTFHQALILVDDNIRPFSDSYYTELLVSIRK